MEGRSPGDKICGREHQENPSHLFPLWHWGISGKYLPPLLKISAGVVCHPCPTLRMRELDFDRALVSKVIEFLQSELVIGVSVSPN